MNRIYIDELVEKLDARVLVARLVEIERTDLIEPLVLYTWNDPLLGEEEKKEQLADMAALDDRRFERECRTAQTRHKLIERDALTTLYNRGKLDWDLEIVAAGVNRSVYDVKRNKNPDARIDAAFVYIDVDHFKKVNDEFGHTHGDLVLRAVATALQESVRVTDTQRTYRVGGEELALIAFPCLVSGTFVLGERIRNNIHEYTKTKGLCGGEGVTVSVGVSTTETALDTKTLIEQADKALYYAKRLGRNRVELYKPV